MLAVENVIGAQEDWANWVTNVETRDTPFLDWLEVGKKPTRALLDYQMDKFADPVENSQLDGAPYTNFGPGETRARAKALIGFYSKKFSISELTEDLTNDVGIGSQSAYEMKKETKELAQDIEVQMLEDADHREDNKVVGYKTRGVGSWVNNSAQALYPVPAGFRTPTASIVTTAIGSLTESAMRTMLQSSWTVNKSLAPLTGFVGLDVKNWFADRKYFIPSSTSTQSTGVIANDVFKDKTITRSIDSYRTDGVQLDLVLTPWLVALTGSATAKTGRGYFLHHNMWQLRWGPRTGNGSGMPKWVQLPKVGTSYEFACTCTAMLVCRSPLGEAKYAPT